MCGLFGLVRFYRKTKTNLIILDKKGVISLSYIYIFIILLFMTTATFHLVWTTLIFPRLNGLHSGFDHFPQNLKPQTDIFNRTHYHFSTTLCNNLTQTINLVQNLINLQNQNDKKALHIHIFTSDEYYEKLTIGLDELLYDENNIIETAYIRMHFYSKVYKECDLNMLMSPFIIFQETLKQKSRMNPIINLTTLNSNFFKTPKTISSITFQNILKNKNILKLFKQNAQIGYIFNMTIVENLIKNGFDQFNNLIESKWRNGIDQILKVIFGQIFDDYEILG